MNKTMFEVNWHYTNEVFSHCTVTPIRVIRQGVLPGCTGETITAIDGEGRKFQGSADNYFSSEKEAWESVANDLIDSLHLNVEQMREAANQTEAYIKHLKSINAWLKRND